MLKPLQKRFVIEFDAIFTLKAKNYHLRKIIIFCLLTIQDVENLAAEVSQLVYRLAGGIGPEPQLVNNAANGLAN